jgi:NitT/TauT family transport system ATP-binding protein
MNQPSQSAVIRPIIPSKQFPAAVPENPKISVRGLRKRFMLRGREVEALDSVDFDIRNGEFFCIVGPSGCGKSTLLRIIAELETKTDGQISVYSSETRRGPLSNMVFQEQSIFPWMTVRDNVAFGLKASGLSKKRRYAIAEPFIEKVGLRAFSDAYPYQLSGGMKQRVSIARAFANDPEILLMDEPFAALDEQTKFILQEELLRIWEETRKTVLYVTHSIDEAIILGDKIMIMSARPGRIKEIIDVASFFPRPRHVDSIKSSPMFGELFGRVWSSLKQEFATR